MNKVKRIIAQKYARAFVHSFSSLLHKDVLLKLSKLVKEGDAYNSFTSLLKLSNINDGLKHTGFERIVADYQLPGEFIPLFDLLIAHKRADLWFMVAKEIMMIAMEAQSIELITISSSHELTEAQKDQLITFFEQKSKKTSIPSFVTDPSLIMGIRMLSTHFYLEHSFKKYSTDIKNLIRI